MQMYTHKKISAELVQILDIVLSTELNALV
jgi:hypothetical protein